MELFVNGTKIAEFKGHFENPAYVEGLPAQEQEMELQKEAVRLIEFLRKLKQAYSV